MPSLPRVTPDPRRVRLFHASAARSTSGRPGRPGPASRSAALGVMALAYPPLVDTRCRRHRAVLSEPHAFRPPIWPAGRSDSSAESRAGKSTSSHSGSHRASGRARIPNPALSVVYTCPFGTPVAYGRMRRKSWRYGVASAASRPLLVGPHGGRAEPRHPTIRGTTANGPRPLGPSPRGGSGALSRRRRTARPYHHRDVELHPKDHGASRTPYSAGLRSRTPSARDRFDDRYRHGATRARESSSS